MIARFDAGGVLFAMLRDAPGCAARKQSRPNDIASASTFTGMRNERAEHGAHAKLRGGKSRCQVLRAWGAR